MEKEYVVWRPDQGQEEEDGHKIRCRDDEYTAAELWADWSDWNSADYSIVKGNDATVLVRRIDKPGCKIFKFNVTGESVRQYYAAIAKP